MLYDALIVLAGVVVAIAVALIGESWKLCRQERDSLKCDVERDAVRSSLHRRNGVVVTPFRASSPDLAAPAVKADLASNLRVKVDRSGTSVEQSEGASPVASPSLRPSLVLCQGQGDLLDLNAERRSTRIERRP